MKKNYYELLEVDKNASPEIIEKAYKVLAKKHHPDLQPDDKKSESEEIFKSISEAYETLSDENKRIEYNSTLEASDTFNDELENLKYENSYLKDLVNNYKNASSSRNNSSTTASNIDTSDNSNINNVNNYYQNIDEARKQAYRDAYVQDLKNRGYKIKYKKTLKQYFKNFLALFLTLIIIFILLHIPFIKHMLELNPFFKFFYSLI